MKTYSEHFSFFIASLALTLHFPVCSALNVESHRSCIGNGLKLFRLSRLWWEFAVGMVWMKTAEGGKFMREIAISEII